MEVEKRGGTTDWGRTFEQRMLAHIAIICTFNPEISDFKLYSNLAGFGNFDDIVLKLQYYNEYKQDEFYLMQLKHKKIISVKVSKVFDDEDGIFNLEKNLKDISITLELVQKYKEFERITLDNVTIILFSNVVIIDEESDNIKLFLLDNCNTVLKKLNTSKDGKIYGITSKLGRYQELLSKLLFYTNQTDAKNLNQVIYEDLKQLPKWDKITIFLNNFFEWYQFQNSVEINKLDVIIMLFDMFLPQLYEFNDCNYNGNLSIIRKLIDNYTMPLLEIHNCKYIEHYILTTMELHFGIPKTILIERWDNPISDTDRINIQESSLSEIIKKKEYSKLKYSDLFYMLWSQKKVPLLIECSNNIRKNKCIEFFFRKLHSFIYEFSFIFIHKQDINPKLNVPNFNTINENVLATIYVSFQDKAFLNFQKLINNDSKVISKISADVLLTLLKKDKIVIGYACTLCQYYMERKVKVKNRNNEYKIKEKELIQSNYVGPFVVYGGKGTGKSQFLYKFQRKLPPNKWVIYLNLRNYLDKLNSIDYSSEEIFYFLLSLYDTTVPFPFLKSLFKFMMKNEHIHIHLDNCDNFTKIDEFVLWSKRNKITLWLTINDPKKIVNKEALYIELQDFSVKDKLDYLKNVCSNEEILADIKAKLEGRLDKMTLTEMELIAGIIKAIENNVSCEEFLRSCSSSMDSFSIKILFTLLDNKRNADIASLMEGLKLKQQYDIRKS